MARHWSKVTRRLPAAERTSSDGKVFDSRGEMVRWNVLRVEAAAGIIRGLDRQIRFPLADPKRGIVIKWRTPKRPKGTVARYTADFVYTRQDAGKVWRTIYEEYKGHDDPTARLRRAVFESLYGVIVTVTGPSARKSAVRALPERATLLTE